MLIQRVWLENMPIHVRNEAFCGILLSKWGTVLLRPQNAYLLVQKLVIRRRPINH